MDVANLISSSSAFSKSSLNIWKFLVHVLLKPSLKDFEHSFASVWNEFNCAVVWNIFRIAFLWNWNFSSPVATAESSKFADIEYSTWTASYFRIWKSSAGISAPPLALLVVMFPKTYFTPHSRMSGCRWVITPSWLSGSGRFFCTVLCILATSS